MSKRRSKILVTEITQAVPTYVGAGNWVVDVTYESPKREQHIISLGVFCEESDATNLATNIKNKFIKHITFSNSEKREIKFKENNEWAVS